MHQSPERGISGRDLELVHVLYSVWYRSTRYTEHGRKHIGRLLIDPVRAELDEY